MLKDTIKIEGPDYKKTFAPVVNQVTIWVILALAATQNWHLHQLDINNSFQYRDLDEGVYIQLPSGYGQKGQTWVCKLNKSLYGLKQTSRQWFVKFFSVIKKIGYKQSKEDYSLFVESDGISFVVILVCMDDIILAGNVLMKIQELKDFLNSRFKLKGFRNLKYFLGIEVARSRTRIYLS